MEKSIGCSSSVRSFYTNFTDMSLGWNFQTDWVFCDVGKCDGMKASTMSSSLRRPTGAVTQIPDWWPWTQSDVCSRLHLQLWASAVYERIRLKIQVVGTETQQRGALLGFRDGWVTVFCYHIVLEPSCRADLEKPGVPGKTLILMDAWMPPDSMQINLEILQYQ